LHNIIVISGSLAAAILRLSGGVVGDFGRAWAWWDRLDRGLRLRATSEQNAECRKGRGPFRSGHGRGLDFSGNAYLCDSLSRYTAGNLANNTQSYPVNLDKSGDEIPRGPIHVKGKRLLAGLLLRIGAGGEGSSPARVTGLRAAIKRGGRYSGLDRTQ
jgi:hypothetical protein